VAGASLLALIDDIASVLDDVAAMTKVASKKTVGLLGDDLALNAQQVGGVRADRELPVVWAVAKGSLLNKAILVPAALAISAIAPWVITPLLMVGGLYLCYEGFEKIWHRLTHREEHDEHRRELRRALVDPAIDLRALEKQKIKGAIRTDFILSAEIIVIALGTVANADFVTRVAVLAGIAVLMTAGVYGLVGGIVKFDDAGRYLAKREGSGWPAATARAMGRGILWCAPRFMRLLSIAGTVAMFLVGGGILVHGIPKLAHWVEGFKHTTHGDAAAAGIGALAPLATSLVVGLVAGGLAVVVVGLLRKVWPGDRGAGNHAVDRSSRPAAPPKPKMPSQG
jgi:predicted DNA repair protein MutK